MTKYKVTLVVDASVTVEVEADSEEEARDKAEKIVEHPCLCHYCAGQLDVGDFTGEVSVEEAE